jgi:calcineurin-like phosphoesterase
VCVANGENAADGIGITPRLADQLLRAGVDAITLGNHAFRRSEIGPYLEVSDRVVRPANTSRETPGRGVAVVPSGDGSIGVINVLGSLFLHPATSR